MDNINFSPSPRHTIVESIRTLNSLTDPFFRPVCLTDEEFSTYRSHLTSAISVLINSFLSNYGKENH